MHHGDFLSQMLYRTRIRTSQAVYGSHGSQRIGRDQPLTERLKAVSWSVSDQFHIPVKIHRIGRRYRRPSAVPTEGVCRFTVWQLITGYAKKQVDIWLRSAVRKNLVDSNIWCDNSKPTVTRWIMILRDQWWDRCGSIRRFHRRRSGGIGEYDSRVGRNEKAGKIGKLFVMGCLSERFKSDLLKEIPEVDHYHRQVRLEESALRYRKVLLSRIWQQGVFSLRPNIMPIWRSPKVATRTCALLFHSS